MQGESWKSCRGIKGDAMVESNIKELDFKWKQEEASCTNAKDINDKIMGDCV